MIIHVAMNTIKLKKIFTISLISLFYSHWIWIPGGNAESVSIVKDLEQVSVNNRKELQAFDTGEKYHQTAATEEDPFTFEIAEERDVLKEWSLYKGYQSTVLEKKISPQSNGKNTPKTLSDHDRPAQPASETKAYPKVKLNLWRFIIISG